MLKKHGIASVLNGAKIELREDRYRADFELLDRYVSFSTEISRLSLLGIGAIGFTISLVFKDAGTNNDNIHQLIHDKLFIVAMLAGLTTLALASAFALAHRYFASDGLYYHLRAIKHLVLREIAQNSDQETYKHREDAILKVAQENEQRRNSQFRISGFFLMTSVISLSIGIGLSGLIFGYLLL